MSSGEAPSRRAMLLAAVLCGCANYVPPFGSSGSNSMSSSMRLSDGNGSARGIAGLRIEEQIDGGASVTFVIVERPAPGTFATEMVLPPSGDLFRGAPMSFRDEPTSTAWVRYIARPGVRISRSIVAATYRRVPRQHFRLTLTLGIPRAVDGGVDDARLGEVRTSASGFVDGNLEVSCSARGGPPITVSLDGGPVETTYALQYDPTVVTRFCRSTLTSLGLLDP